jgi:acetylglutamate kinase
MPRRSIACSTPSAASISKSRHAVAGLAQYADGQQPIRVIGGNFITGQPIGVLDGIDMQYAGKVRKVDAEGIRAQLGLGNIVLLNCEGPSPTGEIFNLQMEEVAEAWRWRSRPTSWST